MSKSREERTQEFHQAFDIAIDQEPTVELLKLRKTLIQEEARELVEEIDAALCHLEQDSDVPKVVYQHMLKELADLQTVLSGTAVSLSPLRRLEEAFERVHKSNMSKLGEDGKPVVREDGKVLKGPNYTDPDLRDLVA